MKKKAFLIALILIFAVEVCAAVYFLSIKPETKQDGVAVNDIVQTVTANWDSLQSARLPVKPDFTVTDMSGNILYRTRDGLSVSLNDAIKGRDTILDIVTDDNIVGKVFIHNDSGERYALAMRGTAAVALLGVFLQAALCVLYLLYIKRTVLNPFARLKVFATRVAGGNFDIPLDMDRHNVFGAFTESFDILRSELKAARAAEAEANKSKKELVAKLSHDIKTPIASIKSVAELGKITAKAENDSKKFLQIEEKADQIDALISNLFQAALEDLQQLSVKPAIYQSTELSAMLKKSDYFERGSIPSFPDCLLSFDAPRLQQVFDNIISNSYKYANTEIDITAEIVDGYFLIHFTDYGGGVKEEELPFILEKFRRGTNAEGKEGVGLGLYISRYLIEKMSGGITVENTDSGLTVTLSIKMSGI